MGRTTFLSVGMLFLGMVGPVLSQDGTARRDHFGTKLPDAGDGLARYREDTGWSSSNFDQPRWAVNYGERLQSTPWAVVLQSDRVNTAFTAGANQLILDLAGHTYDIKAYAENGTRIGGVVTVVDRADTGASLTIRNGTFTNVLTSGDLTYIGESHKRGRLILENADFLTANMRIGQFSGSEGYVILEDGGNLDVGRRLYLGDYGQADIELRGAGSQLTAGEINIGSNGRGTIVLRDPSAVLRVVDSRPGDSNFSIANHGLAGPTPGLRVVAGTVEIDGELVLGSRNNTTGVVSIEGGSVAVGQKIRFGSIHPSDRRGTIFLDSGRLEVSSPTNLNPSDEKQFYWNTGTLAFSDAEISLTDQQLKQYTRQGAISYGGNRAAGSLAAGQTLESAGTLTLTGEAIGLSGGTIRAATELIVEAPLAGYGTLDAVVTGTGTITNATEQTLNAGVLAGSNTIATAGDLRIGHRSVDGIFSGTTSGAGALVKTGTGTQTIAGQVLNSGGVVVEQGVLSFDGSGQRLSTTSVTVADGAIARFVNGATGTAADVAIGVSADSADPAHLKIAGSGSSLSVTGDLTNRGWINLTGGTLAVEGTLINTGTVINDGMLVAAVSGRGTLAGSGAFSGPVSVAEGAVLAPGQSPGVMTFTDLTLGAGGVMEVELGAATGTEGVQWDLAVVTDALAIAATAVDPFQIVLKSLDASLQPGMLDGFDPAEAFSWRIIAAAIANPEALDLEALRLDTSEFVTHNDLAEGTLSLASASDGLYVAFSPQVSAVPEPGSALLLALASTAAGVWRIRRRLGAIEVGTKAH